MTSGGKFSEAIFKGDTINTPSLLAIEDYIFALEWAKSLGGLSALIKRADDNLAALDAWVRNTDWIDHLAADPAQPFQHLGVPQVRGIGCPRSR